MNNEMQNINTITAELLGDIDEIERLSNKLHLQLGHDFCRGMRCGIKALQSKFIDDMDDGKLNYDHRT